MIFPAELKYTKDHEWIRVDGDVAYVGITDYAQGELGEIVFVDITTEGEVVAKEEVFSERPVKVKSESDSGNASEDGERPIRKKKPKGKPSSYNKKPGKSAATQPETKAKDKVKKKAKAKKKKSNAKAKTE